MPPTILSQSKENMGSEKLSHFPKSTSAGAPEWNSNSGFPGSSALAWPLPRSDL